MRARTHYHPTPHTCRAHDPNSGDHGLGFFGSSLNMASYLHNHSALGPLCFLCDITARSATGLTLQPRDSFHRQAYLEPLGLWLVAEAGSLQSVALDMSAGTVTVTFVPSSAAGAAAGLAPGAGAPYALLRLRVSGEAPEDRPFTFALTAPAGAVLDRGAYAFAPNADPEQSTAAVIAFQAKY